MYLIEIEMFTALEREQVIGVLGKPMNVRFFPYTGLRNNERNTLRNTRVAIIVRWADIRTQYIIDFIRIMRGPRNPWLLVMVIPGHEPILLEVTPAPMNTPPLGTLIVNWRDPQIGLKLLKNKNRDNFRVCVKIGKEYCLQQISST